MESPFSGNMTLQSAEEVDTSRGFFAEKSGILVVVIFLLEISLVKDLKPHVESKNRLIFGSAKTKLTSPVTAGVDFGDSSRASDI